MKLYITFFSFLLLSLTSLAQVQYEISKDPKHPEVKVLKGIISRSIIENDTSFQWYAPNKNLYTPDAAVVDAFKRSKDSLSFVVFGGTWCEDTQFLLPKFFKLLELSGMRDSSVSLFGVDRNKQTLGNIAAAFNITNVPTFIVMKNGKEIGRLVEYGKTGKWDKELADIISAN
ncbi:thioredoxin family protein [Ferruginibacter albus]|uniref:thioredoxin family protein n=1 Tax=Ferruginibacter albus TaxID=2875540 RepID=UPI001CC6E750|nr:thioredoxin family protein [Ferruginibacter albus]UAY51857.1 thioredoxin family protein [Ferruginibacter albus]